MKKNILSISSILLISMAFVASCQTPKTKVENAEIKVQEAREE
ncbi:MAG: TlpA family protein disulfide reductase, partial [Bacteroidetes bacterium HGW-Bacteroidetes-20]